MREIKVKNSKRHAIVDDEDYDRVWFYPWRYDEGRGVTATVDKGVTISLGRFIMDTKDPNIIIDHIDRDTFNNLRINLRECTYLQNNYNRSKPKHNTSGFKGVTNRGKYGWEASIMLNGKTIYIGKYDTKEAAAKAYNRAARKHFGEFAALNIIPAKIDKPDKQEGEVIQ